jgi:hypothetical protein
MPWGLKAKLVYHMFESDEGTNDYGEELDVVLVKPINKHVKLLAKYANFDADRKANQDNPEKGAYGLRDTEKIWVQAEFVF